MSSSKHIKSILQEWNLAPKKRFGQNFLIHRSSADRIVEAAGVTKDDIIVEIGVGLGALTIPLAQKAKQVIGLEIDAGIIRFHETRAHFPANVTLMHQDVMKADLKALAKDCGENLKIVANLPYSLSNPLLFKLIENSKIMSWAVVMLQKEVGQRIMAEPGTKAYGILSVLIKTCAKVEKLLEIGPGHFHPKPKVDSLVLRIQFKTPPAESSSQPTYDRLLLHKIVNTAFQQRRKTLLNALSSGKKFGIEKDKIEYCLKSAGISPKARGETLTLENFISLTNHISSKIHSDLRRDPI